jgi:cytochrome c peroxidase
VPADLPEKELKPVLPETAFNYGTDTFPSYFSAPLSFINSVQNPITNDGATLGRVLFYDKMLSANNTVSCGSCHLQSKAFSDPRIFSSGFEGEQTNRNSMAIVNSRFSFRYFWDQRALYAETQVLMPIQNHIEMGMNLGDLVTKLQTVDYYQPLFQKAFGSTEVNVSRISIALAQFVQSLNSYRSRYDVGTQTGFADFSPVETDGMNLFFSGTINCNQCHTTANFYDTSPLNNGLESIYIDKGRGAITNDSADDGKFKVPSLRNIEMSAPYMHDGRFATLEQVVEHYNSGIQANANLDDRLATNGLTGGPPKQYYMTAYQKASVVAFLKTLTDQQFLNDVRFSDPFK